MFRLMFFGLVLVVLVGCRQRARLVETAPMTAMPSTTVPSATVPIETMAIATTTVTAVPTTAGGAVSDDGFDGLTVVAVSAAVGVGSTVAMYAFAVWAHGMAERACGVRRD